MSTIVAGGQFLNGWNWGRQAPELGIDWLREDKLDRREFARVGNLMARPECGWLWGIGAEMSNSRIRVALRAAARVGDAGSQDGRDRPSRICEACESAGSGWILLATLPHACRRAPCRVCLEENNVFKNLS